MEGYCFKCKVKREISDPHQTTMKNGGEAIQGVCPVCGTKITSFLGGSKSQARGGGIPGQPGDDEVLAQGDGSKRAKAKTPVLTKTLDEASFLDIVPKELRMTSTLLHITKHVTEREWDWPVMEEGEWLDNYFYHTMRKFGIRLGGYVVERRSNGAHQGRSDG